ncbi:MAG: hypothetical protein JJ949_10640 [Roseicyclus sp.]|nr:hypothetical protein [Roseicyclus sp.]MBO6924170.1 hypothetical protein [Roseicyclus sp.]
MKDDPAFAMPAALFRDDGTVARFPAGSVVPPHDAAELFAEHFDPAARYISDGRFVRRIVTFEDARERGQSWIFTGERCSRCGRYSVRKLRPEPRGSECLSCRNVKRRKASA